MLTERVKLTSSNLVISDWIRTKRYGRCIVTSNIETTTLMWTLSDWETHTVKGITTAKRSSRNGIVHLSEDERT